MIGPVFCCSPLHTAISRCEVRPQVSQLTWFKSWLFEGHRLGVIQSRVSRCSSWSILWALKTFHLQQTWLQESSAVRAWHHCNIYYLLCLAPLGGGIKRWCCLTSVCLTTLLRISGGEQRGSAYRNTKIGTEVAHVTRDSDTTFKVERSKPNLQGAWHIVAASRTACLFLRPPKTYKWQKRNKNNKHNFTTDVAGAVFSAGRAEFEVTTLKCFAWVSGDLIYVTRCICFVIFRVDWSRG